MGKEDSRKGSTIRALTGVSKEREIEVALLGGQEIRMWTRVRSLNEPEDAKTADQWVTECQEHEKSYGPLIRRNMLIALREPIGRPAAYHARSYLYAMASAGFQLESVITLGAGTPEWVKDLGVPFISIPELSSASRIAQRVREAWGWS
jgi:hypothetical protein